tara:strand:+ start:1131 stop:1448 length:318 start_codon:yes stop_codon:yes gene_type:complete
MSGYARKRHNGKPMRRLSLVKQINQIIPEAEAAFTEDWDGTPTGIWLKGSESTHTDKKGNVQRIFDYWAMEEKNQYHPKLVKILDRADWWAEPHDAGTLMLWPSR